MHQGIQPEQLESLKDSPEHCRHQNYPMKDALRRQTTSVFSQRNHSMVNTTVFNQGAKTQELLFIVVKPCKEEGLSEGLQW